MKLLSYLSNRLGRGHSPFGARPAPSSHTLILRQYFFVHIPKTAGTSFTKFLSDQFEQKRVLRGGFWETIRKQPIDALSRFQLITGHIGYDLAFYLRNPFVLTILRDPVNRLCSVYEYLRHLLLESEEGYNTTDPDIQELVDLWKIAVQRPLPEFLDSPEGPVRASMLENPQARQLAQSTPYLLTDLSHDRLYELAASRMSTIDVVGCAEDFAATMQLACRKTGWSMPADLTDFRLNVTGRRPVRDTLDQKLRKRIESLAEVDMELHAMARRRLSKELADR